jgi:DNA-binding LacI/PurR family transcriptional regulator
MAKTDQLIELSGIPRSTVFRFLRGGNVREPARSAILGAMQRLNMPFERHAVHAGKTLRILVKRDFKAFKGYGLAIAGFMERAEAQGFRVNLKAGSPHDPDADLGRDAPAGVLMLGLTVEEEEYEIEQCRRAGVPQVFVNRVFDDPLVSWVSCDLRRAAAEAVEHLLALGHRAVGTWGVTATSRLDRAKREGFLDALRARGLADGGLALEADRHGDLEEALAGLIRTGRLPSAWFCGSDEHALRFMKVAKENGVRIPDDVAVASMDAVDASEYVSPALTSVRMPFQAEGAAAFDVLKRLIENPDERSVRVVLRHELIVRESCGAARR